MNNIERQIQKIYEAVFKKIMTKSNVRNLSKGSRLSIIQTISILSGSDQYAKFANKFAKELAKKGLNKRKGIWRKYFEAAKSKNVVGLPKTFSEFENQQMEKSISKNFEMIKSIPDKTMEVFQHKYTTVLMEEVAKGKLSRGSFEKQLLAHGHKNAKLIARTETAKLQANITESRSRDLGCVCYEWIASSDKRTRPSHRQMDGVIVFYRDNLNEQPLLDNMQGNAGHFPNCRCSAAPIFDESDFTKNNYTVYDYRIHKKIRMTKNELANAIKNGSLDATTP